MARNGGATESGAGVAGSSDAEEEQADKALHAVSSARVLAAEYALIWKEPKLVQGTDEEVASDYQAKAFAHGQAALCLSGGGIRSAAFALGVLQALSRKGLLTAFQYQSTVSGGGYIGGWLQRWIAEPGVDAQSVMRALGGTAEPPQVSALRENSNFITPRVGIRSNDTWTALAISVRNIAVNWLLFTPLFLLVALVPNLFASGLQNFPRTMPRLDWLYYAELASCGLLTAFSAFSLCRALPSYGRDCSAHARAEEKWVRSRVVLPLIAGVVPGSFVLACDLFWQPHLYLPGTLLAMSTFTGLVAGALVAGCTLRGRYFRIFLHDTPFWLAAAVALAVTIQIGTQALPIHLTTLASGSPAASTPASAAPAPAAPAGAPSAGAPGKPGAATPDASKVTRPPEELAAARWRAALLAMMAPILLLWAQVAAITTFAAFRGGRSAGIQPDSDREWLARVTALEIKPLLAWGMIAFSTLLLFDLMQSWVPGFNLTVSGFIAAVSAAAAITGGRSDRTGIVAGVRARVMRFIPLEGIISAATIVFGLALLMVLSRLEMRFADQLGALIGKSWPLPVWMSPAGAGHWLMVAVLAALLAIFGRTIRANRFSLNGLYRNRLARAFLGGAREVRAPQPFTGFDPSDNIRMHYLKPTANGRPVLYPIVNVALNVTASEKLAWQERKAEPFIFSPIYSGSAMLRTGHGPRTGAYVVSSIYGGNESDLGMGGSGISLATAISISGAAASPNMGYNSSAATAFLMTLFNVRLGAWMPNPARCGALGQDIARSDPGNSVRALLSELAGETDDQGLDVYLSDGGHFENLGLYEMIRRRCRYIVLSDAGADPECKFEDLGNAVRKIKIDLGIDISFEELRISSRTRPIDPQYAWALGKIHYPEGEGQLLYIKPSLFGRLPVDVRSYAEGSAAFPHESTHDQFFSESQFESYRRLGDYFAGALARHDENGVPAKTYPDVGAFFRAVEAAHLKEKASDEEKETRGLLKRVIASLGFRDRPD